MITKNEIARSVRMSPGAAGKALPTAWAHINVGSSEPISGNWEEHYDTIEEQIPHIIEQAVDDVFDYFYGDLACAFGWLEIEKDRNAIGYVKYKDEVKKLCAMIRGEIPFKHPDPEYKGVYDEDRPNRSIAENDLLTTRKPEPQSPAQSAPEPSDSPAPESSDA